MNISVVRDALLCGISGKELLEHPFYRRWVEGEMETRELGSYAEQYRYFEAELPQLIACLASTADSRRACELLERNLSDELGGSGRPSHLSMFDRFASGVGARPGEPQTEATAALIGAHRDLVAESATSGLAGLLAYEMQLPALASTKAKGLRDRFGMDDKTVEFWDLHATLDEDHARWGLEALVELDATAEEAYDSARQAADAWWSFLDEREADRQPV